MDKQTKSNFILKGMLASFKEKESGQLLNATMGEFDFHPILQLQTDCRLDRALLGRALAANGNNMSRSHMLLRCA